MQRRGFSRIEMLLTVAVTGVVAALLLPALAQNENPVHERENAQRTQCQSNLKQIALGIAQYVQDYDLKLPPAIIGGESYGWALAVAPYLKGRNLFDCPSDKHLHNADPREAGYTDYWYNSNMPGARQNRMKSPWRVLLMGDGDGGYIASNARYAINTLPESWITTFGSPARRHLDGANYAFADGHVKWYSPARIVSGGEDDPTFKIK